MATVAELLVKIGADSKQFDKVVKRTEKSLDRMSKKLKDIGEKMTKGLTLPLAAAGFAAGKFASDTKAATGKIQAQLGTTAAEAQKLGDIAENVWKNAFGESLDEVAGALTTVKRNMQGVAETDLQPLTESAFILRDAFGADIAQSTKTAGTLMKNFGIDGQKAFDLMTVGFQKGGDFSGELLDTLNEYAPQFAALGMSAEDALNLLISGAQNGAFNLDKVGDAVKEFNVRATDGSKTTAAGFAALGLDAELFAQKIAEGGPAAEGAFQTTLAALASIKDPLAQDRAGVALFGTQWEDLSGKVVTAMTNTVDQLGAVDGATQRAGTALNDNFGTRLTETWRNAQSALEPLGDRLLSLADEWLPKISTAIESVVNWFTNLSPKTQELYVKIGIIVAAIGPLLIGLGMLVTAFKSTLLPMGKHIIKLTAVTLKWAFLGTESKRSALTVVKSWAMTAAAAVKNTAIHVAQAAVMVAKWVWMGVQSLAQAARMAAAWVIALGPIAWVTAAVIAIAVLIIANWDKIKAFTIKIWDATMKWLGETWNNLVSFGKEAFKKLWEGIKAVFFSLLKGGIIGLVNDFILKPFFDIDLFEIGKNLIQGLWNGIKDMGAWIKSKVTGFVEGIGDTIKNFFGISSPSKLMAGYGGNIVEGLTVGIERNADKAKQAMEQMMQSTVSELDRLGDAVKTALQRRYDWEERIQLKSLTRQSNVLKKATEDHIKRYNEEHDAKLKLFDASTDAELKALRDQIDAIDGQTDAEEKAIKEQEFQNRLAAKQKELIEATTAEEKLKITTDLNQMIADREREHLLESRQAQISALQAQMEAIRTNADLKREQMKVELDEKVAHEQELSDAKVKSLDNEMEAVKTHFEFLTSEEALQAEARRLAIDTNNKEMIDLLKTFNPDWQNAGQSFGDSLINGLNSRKASIQSAISNIMSMVGKVGGFSTSAIQEQMKANSAKWLKTTDPKIREQLHQKNVELAKQIPGATFNTKGTWNIPQLATGTNFVPKDMFAFLHEGEAVVPKKFNDNGGSITVIVEMDGRQIARGTAPHIVDLIRVKTGLRI